MQGWNEQNTKWKNSGKRCSWNYLNFNSWFNPWQINHEFSRYCKVSRSNSWSSKYKIATTSGTSFQNTFVNPFRSTAWHWAEVMLISRPRAEPEWIMCSEAKACLAFKKKLCKEQKPSQESVVRMRRGWYGWTRCLLLFHHPMYFTIWILNSFSHKRQATK